ncbi:MAG: hypothetical protein ACRD0V_07160, partial [Acidimicrobiales bacterium]
MPSTHSTAHSWIPPDTTPTGDELHAAVHHLVDEVVRRHGPLPGVGTPRWWAAPDDARLAALLILAEAW